MEFDLPKDTNSIIKVIGVGGGGSNAVNHMYGLGIVGVDFIVCNTDRQALDISPVPYKIQLGPSLTEGRGAGAIPEIGMNAAIENINEIRDVLSSGTKMVFVTAGMGGGTGTGAAPVIAQVARELGILTVGIVTVPFGFEGRKRRLQAEEGLEKLRESVDTLLVINNERLREISGNLSIGNAFAMADNVLSTAAKGIAEVISVTGAINVDFNDVNTVMRNSGVAIMGSASAEGEDRALNAVQEALTSPLLNDNDISGATYVLLNITYGDKEVLMDEITTITDYIQDEAGSTADVIWGHGYDPTLGDKLSVTLVATGFASSPITGLERAPERKVRTLEDEPKNEIKAPLSNPTEMNRFVGATEIESPLDEPFIKTDMKSEEPVSQVNTVTTPTELSFDWELNATPSTPAAPVAESSAPQAKTEEVKRFMLEDDMNDLSLDATTKQVLSPEEQQRRNTERMSKIQEFTSRLRKADGISEFENEPAFVRRNVNLNTNSASSNDNISRFGLSEDEDRGVLRNNNFLHDNVD